MEELSGYDGRGLHLNSQCVQLELLLCELVAAEVFEGSGGITTRDLGLVKEALSVLKSVAKQRERGSSKY